MCPPCAPPQIISTTFGLNSSDVIFKVHKPICPRLLDGVWNHQWRYLDHLVLSLICLQMRNHGGRLIPLNNSIPANIKHM